MNSPSHINAANGFPPAAVCLNAFARSLAPLRAALLLATAFFALPAGAQISLYLLTTDARLATTSAANPGANTTPVTITGVTAGETLVAIDVRPQNQKLYALGVNATNDTATLYHLAPETGFASPVGTASSVAFTTNGTIFVDFPDPATVTWDIDFNPAADRLRVVAGGLNFRITPNNGAAVDGDNTGLTSGAVTGTNPDGSINGATTTVGAAAYTNNQPNSGGVTTQYTLDASSNSLFIQNPPNTGAQTLVQPVTLGGSTLDFSRASFDIATGVNALSSGSPVTSGAGLMVATVGGADSLYVVNLVNAQATLLGAINLTVRSAAIRTGLGAAVALAASGNSLIRFDPATPGTTTTQAINLAPVVAGETLVAMDARAQTGQLYGLGVNATTNTASLYLIDPQVGTLTLVSTPSGISFVLADGTTSVDFPDPATTGYGMDFNPTLDRIRVVAGNGLNFRVNPNNGAPVDGNLNNTVSPPPNINTDAQLNDAGSAIAATAYTNSFGQSLTGGVTTQYALGSSSNALFLVNTPNSGLLTLPITVTLGGSPLDVSPTTGFDIPSSVTVATSNTPATGEGWFATTVGSLTGVYRLDLSSGVATFLGNLGAGSTPISSLVVWATIPEIAVESPVGTPLVDNADTIDFGTPVVGTSEVRTVQIRNLGSNPLTYSAALDTGGAFTITQNATGTVAGSATSTITLSFTAGAAGTATDTLRIASNDNDETSFDIDLTATAITTLTDDIAIATTGETRLNPLANDALDGTAVITGVSDPAIAFDERTLFIPEGFLGSFFYTASDATTDGAATVTVFAGTPLVDPSSFNGILYDAGGNVAGWVSVAVSARGVATVVVRGGVGSVKAKIIFPSGVATASSFTKLGNLTLVLNPNGTASATLSALGGRLNGELRAARTTATPEKHHIALASIDATIPGGGYVIVTLSNKGLVKLTGVLPDGLPFSAATALADNGSIAFFTPVTKGAKPPAVLGGELLIADLSATDVTGEILWSKLPQSAGAKGTHLDGLETILTANGSLYAGVIPLNGAGTLNLTGGNLAADESNAVAVTEGFPPTPTGSLTRWTGAKPSDGKFSATVVVPGIAKPVKGSGLYLPKSNRAWGYFPGKTVGGRIELTVP